MIHKFVFNGCEIIIPSIAVNHCNLNYDLSRKYICLDESPLRKIPQGLTKPFSGISYYISTDDYLMIRYYKEGVLHREDGPAVKYYYAKFHALNPKDSYCLNGEMLKIIIKINKTKKILLL